MACPLSIFCKSYRTDLRRVIRLLESIKKYNKENIPVYISVPEADLDVFRKNLGNFNFFLVSDLEIVTKNPKLSVEHFNSLPGNISQQIVKAEFWRLATSENYLCIDSDATFIRPFEHSSYISESGTPYTVIDQGLDILNDGLRKSRRHVIENFLKDSRKIKEFFDRKGLDYSFGPFPVVWNHLVWKSLEEDFFTRKNLNILDAIHAHPVESHWYGEALLRFKSIPLLPRQPIFFVYHYGWQYNEHKAAGIGEPDLALLYDGVIYQSAWERELDWPTEGGTFASKLARRFRRAIGRA